MRKTCRTHRGENRGFTGSAAQARSEMRDAAKLTRYRCGIPFGASRNIDAETPGAAAQYYIEICGCPAEWRRKDRTVVHVESTGWDHGWVSVSL